jgi:hypothetical protein
LLSAPLYAEDLAVSQIEAFARSDTALAEYQDFSDLVLRLDLDGLQFRNRDVVSVWTEFATSGRRIGGDELRFDWTPVTDQLISRRNRMANFKPSSGLGVDFDAPSESVVLEWRIGF